MVLWIKNPFVWVKLCQEACPSADKEWRSPCVHKFRWAIQSLGGTFSSSVCTVIIGVEERQGRDPCLMRYIPPAAEYSRRFLCPAVLRQAISRKKGSNYTREGVLRVFFWRIEYKGVHIVRYHAPHLKMSLEHRVLRILYVVRDTMIPQFTVISRDI